MSSHLRRMCKGGKSWYLPGTCDLYSYINSCVSYTDSGLLFLLPGILMFLMKIIGKIQDKCHFELHWRLSVIFVVVVMAGNFAALSLFWWCDKIIDKTLSLEIFLSTKLKIRNICLAKKTRRLWLGTLYIWRVFRANKHHFASPEASKYQLWRHLSTREHPAVISTLSLSALISLTCELCVYTHIHT